MNTELESILTPELRAIRPDLHQRSIPALAKDPDSVARIRDLLVRVETTHEVVLGDAREVRLSSSSVHLVVTSPPYWTLKEYPDSDGQMANVQLLSPEIVTGYVMVFDTTGSGLRKDGTRWVDFFRDAVNRLSGRDAPA